MNEQKFNRDTQYWQDLDRKHHLHPFSDMASLNAKGSIMIEDAQGVFITDTDGKEYLDGMSGLWCVNMGYGNKVLADAAYEQMKRLSYYNSFFQTAATPMAELGAKLAEVTPEGFEHVFYSSSGSEANDTVVRLVRYYWQALGHKDKNVIIARTNGYHGSTIAGLSLGGMSAMHAQGGPMLSDIVHIPQPYWYGEAPEGMSEQEFGIQRAQEVEKAILKEGADRVAAFIGEPIQGAGGVIVPPSTYWPEVQRICDKYDILLVADEVICGFGRTGNWFGSETLGIKPDLMTMAKGMSSGYLPISGVMVGRRVAQGVMEQFGEFAHGYTYSGHPVSCAVALANIELMQSSNIMEKLKTDTVPYFQAMITRLGEHPLIGHAMGVGMLGGVVMMKDTKNKVFFENGAEIGAMCRDFCYENGLVMRAVGARMVLAPPLTLNHEEIDEIERRATKAFDQTQEKLSTLS